MGAEQKFVAMPNQVMSAARQERENQLQRLEQIRASLAEARKTGNWDKVPPDVYRDYLAKVVLTSAPSLANYLDFVEVDFITAEHIYTLDLAVAAAAGDHSGMESQLQQANEAVLQKLRDRALRRNADAVIAVDVKHVLLDAAAGQKRFVVIAAGTAVRFDGS